MPNHCAEKSGAGGKTVSSFLDGAFIDNNQFFAHLDRRTEATCETIARKMIDECLKDVIHKISFWMKFIISPLVIALVSVSLYVFATINQQLYALNTSVQSLNQNIASLGAALAAQEKQMMNNKQAIDRLEDRLYDKQDK